MTTAGEDPRPAFLKSLDLSACRVEYASAPLVLVCGGHVPEKAHPDAPDPAMRSLRHAISKSHTDFEIFRPEEITNWHNDGVFKDLMSLEQELANICSLIVIIVESVGSMVELGAFSQLPDLAEKLITISSGNFGDDTSFVNLGILRFLAAKNDSRVKRYPWKIDKPEEISMELVEDIVADIKIELGKLPASTLLKVDEDAHCTVFISELIRLFGALKESEIFEYLSMCGFAISMDKLRSKIFLLIQFRVIKIEEYSAKFYIAGKEPFHRLRLAAIDKIKIADALRIETLCLDFYHSDPTYKNWHRAITRARKAAGK